MALPWAGQWEDRGLGPEGKVMGMPSFILYNVSDGGAEASQV